ncbi:hypothetical protein X757_01170 [Mesorhizobium sp. LSHC414A00]|nr:hypothetical protein X757_01170 [Mesorhizobium sp. LSHC414A00]
MTAITNAAMPASMARRLTPNALRFEMMLWICCGTIQALPA